MIHTKLHRLMSAMSPGKGQVVDKQANAILRMVLPTMQKVPHYVLSDELLSVMEVTMVENTVEALMDAGVARMPYNQFLVEMRQQTKQLSWGTVFMLVEQPFPDASWLVFFVFMHDDGRVQSTVRPVKVSLKPFNPLLDDHIEQREGRPSKYVYETSEAMGTIGVCMAASLGIMLTLTHTRGVVSEKVTSDDLKKLNKARAAKGKPDVMPYTVFKIGHTYTASGERKTWAPGCKMKPHLRAGHTRRQRYGTGREQTKLVFIEPVLVNCESVDDVKFRPKVVVP